MRAKCRDCEEGKHGACIGEALIEFENGALSEVECWCASVQHMPVPDFPDAGDSYIVINGVGGYVCCVWEMPTESEPCREHQPNAWAAAAGETYLEGTPSPRRDSDVLLIPAEMRILTVRQPWAWAIIHGGKDVENRVRNIAGDYRGPVAIHAAKADDPEAWRGLAHTSIAAYGRAMESAWSLIGGAIIGVVDLVDVHVSKRSTTEAHEGEPVCFDNATPTGWTCSPWAEPDAWHLVLANPRPLAKPIPYRGALGLRKLDVDMVARIEAAIA